NWRQQYRVQFTYFDILSTVAFISFLIWMFFYLNPDMLALIVVIASAFIVINADTIVSFLNSLLIVSNYKVGQRIYYQGKVGIIHRLSPLSVRIRLMDENGMNLAQDLIIPNKTFLKEDIVVLTKANFEHQQVDIRIDQIKQKSWAEVWTYLEEKILEPELLTRSYNYLENKQKNYHLRHFTTANGELICRISWLDTVEHGEEIKAKIISYLHSLMIDGWIYLLGS
ncbi:MAG TPA: hypothetical protein PLQ36_03230, partial [Candidatus Gracilibacteria bacterium]|nr:hypothetical protein [Candidatus Gracilibacteria bacterium]